MKRAAVLVMTAVVIGVGAPAAAAPGPADAPEYWFDRWHVPALWADGARGQGVTIAEIDTGVNAALPELKGRILSGTDLGRKGDGHVDREVDGFGHGTAMASIMVARPGLLGITGLAPEAKILPIAIPLNGTTDAGLPDKLPEAIRYAADHHAKIINMSLGGKRTPKVDQQPCSDEEQAAIYYALRKGALIIASVGNTGPKKNTIEDPGVCLGVISVGAVDATGGVADFSARQPYLTLAAPGVDVASLGRVAGQAYSGDGTSQASALTSAAAALVWSRHPQLSARAVATRLLATLDARRSKPSPAYGYGLLNAYRAVTATVAPDSANPVFAAVAPFMTRAAALAAPRPAPPKPAAKAVGATGRYEVGSAPRLTTQVILGIALAAAGLLVLLVLLGVGLRARRRHWRAGLHPLPLLSGPSGPEWPATTAHSAENWPLNEVPRPRPSPHPHPPVDDPHPDPQP